MNRAFDEKISREHFVVIVQEVDMDSIWGTHPYNCDLVSFFNLEHVISIHQEEVIDPSKPEHMEMIKEYEKKTGKKVQGDLKKSDNIPESLPNTVQVPVQKNMDLFPILNNMPAPKELSAGDATFVDIESLERLAENTRRAFEEYDKFDLRRKT
jgi:hypothetical protein